MNHGLISLRSSLFILLVTCCACTSYTENYMFFSVNDSNAFARYCEKLIKASGGTDNTVLLTDKEKKIVESMTEGLPINEIEIHHGALYVFFGSSYTKPVVSKSNGRYCIRYTNGTGLSYYLENYSFGSMLS